MESIHDFRSRKNETRPCLTVAASGRRLRLSPLVFGVAVIAAFQAAADPTADLRERMVSDQIERRGVTDARVLQAMRNVPRHQFVPEPLRNDAYFDSPLPIGHDQTISQPYIVALMTELLDLEPDERVLEIGTGSGYQAAVLAELSDHVYSIEIIEELANQAALDLAGAGYQSVQLRTGDGYAGWPEEAPFDAIIVTCAPERVPQPLVEQLREGGRMVIPVGVGVQELVVLTKVDGELAEEKIIPVRFVPMTGQALDPNPPE